MNRLEQLHKAYEAQQPNKDGWTFTKDVLPPRDQVIEAWIKCGGLDIVGQRMICRYMADRELKDIHAWKLAK